MAKIYDVYLGGDKLKYPWENWMDNSNSDPLGWLPYAAHLKRTHYTIPFNFNRFAPHWQNWFNESEISDLEDGEGFGATLLSQGSEIRKLVFFNKKALPGTTVTLKLQGTTGTEPADLAKLTDAVDKAKTEYQNKTTEATKAPDDAAKQKAKDAAKKKLDEAEAALVKATSTEIGNYDIDLSNVGWHAIDIGEFLQTNGKLDIVKKSGTLINACFTAFVDVVDFYDEHECDCGVIPCETEYPDALCHPAHI